MQLVDDRLILSASDLINHLECAHLTSLDLGVARGALMLEQTRTDAADLVARKGDEFELFYVESLRAAGREVVEIVSEPGLEGLRRGAGRTLDAMRGGAEVIYQAVLFDGERWRGYADFLERVDALSALGERSYEVADRRDSARQCAGSDDAQRVVEGADGREHRDKAGHPRATGVDHELQEVRLGRADAS